MHIEISIPRPWLTLGIVAAIAAWGVWMQGGAVTVEGSVMPRERDEGFVQSKELAPSGPESGGDPVEERERIADAEREIERARVEQVIRERKGEILLHQLRSLEERSRLLPPGAPADEVDAIRQATLQLVALMKDERRAEEELLDSFRALWEAEGRAAEISRAQSGHASGPLRLAWPVDPSRGLTALFDDASYAKFFGYKHNAVDIRAAKGSIVRAAAAGVVKDATMDGAKFSSLVIESQGFTHLYGHMDQFFVEDGDRVEQGEAIGYSNGERGEVGAGNSTGPHLHFALYVDGSPVDPIPYLPPVTGITPE